MSIHHKGMPLCWSANPRHMTGSTGLTMYATPQIAVMASNTQPAVQTTRHVAVFFADLAHHQAADPEAPRRA